MDPQRMESVMKQDSSGAEQGGSCNSEQRLQPGEYDGRSVGSPPEYAQQGPSPQFQHKHGKHLLPSFRTGGGGDLHHSHTSYTFLTDRIDDVGTVSRFNFRGLCSPSDVREAVRNESKETSCRHVLFLGYKPTYEKGVMIYDQDNAWHSHSNNAQPSHMLFGDSFFAFGD